MVVETLNDIVEEFPDALRCSAWLYQAVPERPATSPEVTHLSPQEAEIVALLSSEGQQVYAIIQASQLRAHVVTSILGTLELRGLDRQLPGSKQIVYRRFSMADETLDERK